MPTKSERREMDRREIALQVIEKALRSAAAHAVECGVDQLDFYARSIIIIKDIDRAVANEAMRQAAIKAARKVAR